MNAYNQFSHSQQELACAVENLSLEDEIIAPAFWNKRQPLTPDDTRLMWAIITKWQQGDCGAAEALAALKEYDLDNPSDLMLGFAAVQTARAENPPLPPSPIPSGAPGTRSTPSEYLLDVLSSARSLREVA